MNRLAIFMSALLLTAYFAVAQNSFKDPRDGKIYRTVEIGNQTWMAENLNYLTKDSYCFDDKQENCSMYGRLYTWEAAESACPAGWHLPSKGEFVILMKAVGGFLISEGTREDWDDAGPKLKSGDRWAWNDEVGISGNADDAFGFSAFPAGRRNAFGVGTGMDYYAGFWSSTKYDSDSAYGMHLYSNFYYASLDTDVKYYGLSIRCLKD